LRIASEGRIKRQRVKEPGRAKPRQQGMKPIIAARPNAQMQVNFCRTEQAHDINVGPQWLMSRMPLKSFLANRQIEASHEQI